MAGTATKSTNGHRRSSSVRELRQDNAALEQSYELVQERLAELELALDSRDWIEMGERTAKEFTREGLRRICYLARIHYVKNPLIKRAVEVQRYYVWAQGVSITARHPGINDVVQQFVDDPKNRAELTSHQARSLKEVDLQCEANIFFALFRDEISGRVRIRTIPFDEIEEVIKNPEDRKDPWFYKRMWTQVSVDVASGRRKEETRTDYYPALQYDPIAQPAQIGGKEVHWDTRILHLRVGGMSDMTFGVPEVYAAIDWAKAVKQDLEDFATLRRALARFAWSLTVKGGTKGITSAKTKMASTLGAGDGTDQRPPPVTGSTFISAEGAAALAPMRTAGAAPHPDDARRLGLMVAAAVGLPETILFGDADVGNLATSKTLDRPTELKIVDRQSLWADTLRIIFDYTVRATLKATSPTIDVGGVAIVTEDNPPAKMNPRELLVITDVDSDGQLYTADVAVDFPPVLEHDPEMAIKALVSGSTLDGKQPAGTMPRKEIARHVMTILNVDNIDAMLDKLWPEGSDENAVPEGYEPPEPASPFGAFTPGGGAQPPEDPGAFSAALTEFRTTLAPVLERWAKEHPEGEAFVARIEERLRTVGETIATSIAAAEERATEAAQRPALTDRAREQLRQEFEGITSAVQESFERVIATRDAEIAELRESAAKGDDEARRRLEALEQAPAPAAPTVVVNVPEQKPPTVNVTNDVRPSPVAVEVQPAPVTVRAPKRTRTTVTKSDAEGTPQQSETEVVEE